MKHFLVTRFNLTVTEWKTTRNGELVLTEKWLKNRFNLFEKYCLPSVKNQTNQNFIWCVFFDINTPIMYRKKINSISEDYPNFRPIFIDGNKMLNSSFIEYINKHTDINDDYVITTRLDNDDLIHKSFIKIIQTLYKPMDKMIIDLRDGYNITLGKSYSEIRKYSSGFNPFISVIETTNKFETILSKMHQDWESANNIVVFNEMNLWIELVHKENKINSTKKNLKRIYKINNSSFGLVNELKFKEQPISVFISNMKLDIDHFRKLFKTLLNRFFK